LRPDRKARLLRQYRTRKNGLTTVEIIPADLFEEIKLSLSSAPELVDEGWDDAIAIEIGQPDPFAVEDEPAPDGASEPAISEPVETAAPEKPESGGAEIEKAQPAPVETALASAQPQSIQPNEVLSAQPSQSGETLMIVATYERLLAEKENRLLDLRAALEAERENSKRLAEALGKEQDLRAEPQKKSWWSRIFGS